MTCEKNRWGRLARDATPAATYQVILDAAYNANQDNPAFTNQTILTFLQQQIGGFHGPTIL